MFKAILGESLRTGIRDRKNKLMRLTMVGNRLSGFWDDGVCDEFICDSLARLVKELQRSA